MTIRTDTEANDTTPDEPQGTEPTATVEDTAVAAEGAPDPGTSANEDEPTVLETFRLEDVPEQLRPHVELYVRQANGDYTRKTQELARERADVEELRQLGEQLASEETREQALAAFLAKYDYELADDDDDDAEEIELPGGAGGDDDPVLAAVHALTERLNARDHADEQAQVQRTQAEHNARVVQHVETALADFGKTEGLEEGKALPKSTRDLIIGFAAALPRLPDGMPDMKSAIAQFDSARAAEVARVLKAKKVPDVDLSGSSGQPRFDARDDAARLKAANAVAERSLARHA